MKGGRNVVRCGKSLWYQTLPFVMEYQGGNFHLKVGGEGAKSSGNAGDPMLGVAVIP